MNSFNRHVIVIAITLSAVGIMLMIFMAYKIFDTNSKVSSLVETLSGWDYQLND